MNPNPSIPPLATATKRPQPGKPPSVFRAIAERILFVLPFAASAALLWWTLQRITPVTKQSQSLSQSTSTLAQQIDQMELRRAQAQKEKLADRYTGALNRYLSGEEALGAWLDELRAHAVTLALEVTPTFGEITTREIADESLSVLPVTLEIHPSASVQSDRSAYQRIIDLTLFVCTHAKRADIRQLSVSGQEGAAAHALVNLNLWGIKPKT